MARSLTTLPRHPKRVMLAPRRSASVALMTRRLGIVVMLGVATLLWFVEIFGVWAQRQALNTQNGTTTSEGVLRNEKVRVAVSGLLLDRLYQSAPVENRVREELPPQL